MAAGTTIASGRAWAFALLAAVQVGFVLLPAGLLAMAAQRRWSVLGYWDADLSTALDQVVPIHAALVAQPDAVLAIGSRQRRAGEIGRAHV